jgi:hypothetical protein
MSTSYTSCIEKTSREMNGTETLIFTYIAISSVRYEQDEETLQKLRNVAVCCHKDQITRHLQESISE